MPFLPPNQQRQSTEGNILLSASLIKLQKMIDICFDQGSKLDIQFNPSKS